MDELQDTMSYGKEDLEGRLGRNKDSELSAMPRKDEGEMKDTPQHFGINKKPGMKPEDEDISPSQMKRGDPGQYGDDDIGEDEKLTGRLMRLRA